MLLIIVVLILIPSWFKSNYRHSHNDVYGVKTLYHSLISLWSDYCRWYLSWSSLCGRDRRNFRFGDRNIVVFLKGKETTHRFFREYRQHSKEIGRVISQVYGSNIFGSCEYRGGELKRTIPNNPQIENAGLAREHLKKGYPEVWKQKTQADSELVAAFDETKKIIEEYEQVVLRLIPEGLTSKDTAYYPEKEGFGGFYYGNNVLSSIFDETALRIEGNPTLPAIIFDEQIKVKNNRGDDTSVNKFTLRHRGSQLAVGDERQITELSNVFGRLILDLEVEKKVKGYFELIKKVNSNENAKGFYKSIEDIWAGINQEGDSLEGKGACKHCPQKSFLDYF